MEVEDGARTRTRTRTRSRPATAAKRRKLGGEFAKLSSPTSANSAAEEDRYRSSDSDSDSGSDGKAQVSSCCCSNGLSELAEAGEAGERIGDGDLVSVSDLEVDDESTEAETSTHHIHSRRERREMTPSSNLQESTAVPAENIMPTEFELDEFFAAAEKDVQTRFAEKYNYDISRDAPLEGCFEWVRLKPEQQRNDGVSG